MLNKIFYTPITKQLNRTCGKDGNNSNLILEKYMQFSNEEQKYN